MARAPSDTDFSVTVEDIGTFTFGRRTMRDEIKVQVEYARLIDGVEATDWLATVCGWLSTLRVMTVRAPEGWDLDALDPLEDSTYERLLKVNKALGDKEGSFRRKHKVGGEGTGQGDVQDAGVLVSPEVPADNS